MTSLMRSLEKAATDPLLGLMLAARADTRPGKVDLGVGIYRDREGRTPVMAAVKDAERLLLETEETKAYEGPQGNPAFGELIGRLILGTPESRQRIFATPGGSGALYVGMKLAKLASPTGRVFLSEPTWPNHIGIARAMGWQLATYTYRSRKDGRPDFDLVMEGLADAKAGDLLLLQGPCHNPTGTDFSLEQWESIASFVTERGLLPLVDIAYQGFGEGLDADIAPIRAFLRQGPEALVTYSCSKNFGIYRERTGAVILQAPDDKAADTAGSQAAAIIRSTYSMPPSHGPALVATILSDDALRAKWNEELGAMQERINRLREAFSAAMVRETNDDRFDALARQKGMFSLLPLGPDGPAKLRDEHAIYLPDSGRMNVAGLTEERAGEVASVIARYL